MQNLILAVIIGWLIYITKVMAKKADVEKALTEVEEAVTSEIEQIKGELEKIDNVPDSIVDRLTALRDRVKGIVADPAEGGEGSSGDKPTASV
jgi:hypothetical protein